MAFFSSVLEKVNQCRVLWKGGLLAASLSTGQMLLPVPCQGNNLASVSCMEQLNSTCETEARVCLSSCSGNLHFKLKEMKEPSSSFFFSFATYFSNTRSLFFFKGQLIIACKNKHS